MKTEYVINEYLTITEKTTKENNKVVYNYYIGKNFVFGVFERFSRDDLERLYENGYFENYIPIKVIFRKDRKTGEIIAFFPESYNYGDVMCYLHIGQHTQTSINYYWSTKRAAPAEYSELLTELTDLVGYKNLKIMQRFTY